MVFARGTDEPPGVGKVGGAFVDSLRRQTKRYVNAYGVNYPADKDFLAATNGANDASGHVQQMAGNCPNTKMVLGGYSQGAAVIDIVIAAPCRASAFSSRCRAARPARRRGSAVREPSGRAGGLMGALSPNFAGKMIDLCNQGDPICSDGNEMERAPAALVPGMSGSGREFRRRQALTAASADPG